MEFAQDVVTPFTWNVSIKMQQLEWTLIEKNAGPSNKRYSYKDVLSV
jgi:hypothetical protein